MNENIDLTKILKDCPIGWEFYSSIYGNVTFYRIENSSEYPVKFFYINKNNSKKYGGVTEQGLYVSYFNGECTLFPSKDQRDWSKFTAPWYKKESNTIDWIKKQCESNPYSGVSFKYNGHTWSMCGRDNGVEIIVDGEIKEKIFLDNKPKDKSALEAIKEEKVYNKFTKTLCSKYTQKLYNLSDTGKNKQKPADKIESKFKVGDWIITPKNEVLQITSIEGTSYRFNNESHYWEICCCDEQCRFWTIQDAKDGDVFVNGSNIFIFHFINNRRLMGYCHVNMDNGNFYNDIGKNECFCTIDAPVTPATKEQRDVLMKAMNDAGYEWDIEKKELNKKKKFDPKTLNPFDKVLVRDSYEHKWRCALYSHTIEGENFSCRYVTENSTYEYCIPYNDDTKYLLGTRGEVPKFYRYWEI